MGTQTVFRVLALRHWLRQRDRWTRRQLEGYQGSAGAFGLGSHYAAG
jgi:hypothetical protein